MSAASFKVSVDDRTADRRRPSIGGHGCGLEAHPGSRLEAAGNLGIGKATIGGDLGETPTRSHRGNGEPLGDRRVDAGEHLFGVAAVGDRNDGGAAVGSPVRQPVATMNDHRAPAA